MLSGKRQLCRSEARISSGADLPCGGSCGERISASERVSSVGEDLGAEEGSLSGLSQRRGRRQRHACADRRKRRGDAVRKRACRKGHAKLHQPHEQLRDGKSGQAGRRLDPAARRDCKDRSHLRIEIAACKSAAGGTFANEPSGCYGTGACGSGRNTKIRHVSSARPIDETCRRTGGFINAIRKICTVL